MHTLTPAACERIKLETILHAVTYYQLRLAEELQRDAQRPEHMQALAELRDLWTHRIDVCQSHAIELKERLAELAIDHAYTLPAESVKAKPKRRSKAKAVEGWT